MEANNADRVLIIGGGGERGRVGREARGGRGRVGRGRGGGQRPGTRRVVSDDIRATVIDHVINHGLTMTEAGQRVQPNLSRFTVAGIVRTFINENRYVTIYCNVRVPMYTYVIAISA